MITAIRDLLTNNKKIAKAQALADQYHAQTDATSANTFGTAPIIVQNEEQARIAANQGLVQDKNNPLMFRSPAYENTQLWNNLANTRVDNATDTYMDYLGNPVNTVIDRVADVANLPFSILGQGRVIPDPSARAEKRYYQALDDNTKIAAEAQKKYTGERTAVAKTLSGLLGGMKSPPPDFTNTNKLRSEFTKISEPFMKVNASMGRMAASVNNPSAAGDLALIFNYMKMLDPGSTVREGEFANAQNSAGVPQRIVAKYNSLLSGERLGDTQRADFFNRAKDLFKEADNQHQRNIDVYSSLSERYGVDPQNVVVDFRTYQDVNKGFVLMIDKDGNQAYVNSKTGEIREAK